MLYYIYKLKNYKKKIQKKKSNKKIFSKCKLKNNNLKYIKIETIFRKSDFKFFKVS